MDQENLMKEIQSCFQTQEAYAKLKKFKEAFKDQPQQLSILICDTICLTMTEGTPMSKLLALRLCKEMMDFKSEYFTKQVNDKLLSKFIQIASFRKNDQSDQRGKYLFSDNPSKENAAIGNSLMKLCLDCIKVWAVWYPQSHFKQVYDQMISEGVVFPSKFTYFKEFIDNPSSLTQSQILSSTSSKEQQVKQLPISVKPKQEPKQLLNQIYIEFDTIRSILEQKELAQALTDLKLLLATLESEKAHIEQTLVQIIDSGEEGMIEEFIQNQEIIDNLVLDFQNYLKIQNWNLLKTEMKNHLPKNNTIQQSYQTPQPISDQQMNQSKQPNQSSNQQSVAPSKQKLSVIREETQQDDQDKQKKIDSDILQIKDQQFELNNMNKPQQLQQVGKQNSQQSSSSQQQSFKKKALSLQIDEDQNIDEMKKFSQKQTDYTNTKQTQKNEKNPVSVMDLGPPDDEYFDTSKLETKNIQNSTFQQKPSGEILKSLNQGVKQQKLVEQSQQQDHFEIMKSTEIQQIFQKQHQNKRESQQIEVANQDQNHQQSEGQINTIQQTQYNTKKLKEVKDQDQEPRNSEIKHNNMLTLSQLSQRKTEQFQNTSPSKTTNVSFDLMKVEMLKEEKNKMQQDYQELYQRYEQKQKQYSQQLQEKINEIAMLKKIQYDYTSQEKSNSILIHQATEFQKVSIELSTQQYQNQQLRKQYNALSQQHEELKKECALKSKQIAIQSKQISDLKQQFQIQFEQKKRSESVGQYSKTAQQFCPTPLVNQSFYFEEESIISESQRNLIFPFANPQDYYRDKIQKQYKGQLTFLQSDWLNIDLDIQNMHQLRQSILQKKSILFTCKHLEIGCKIEKAGDKNLFLNLYFLNANKLSTYQIDLNILLANEIISDVQKRQHLQLYQDSSEEISFQLRINEVPFGISTINFKLQSAKSINQMFYLPITIFPFINFMNITKKEYMYYWNIVKNQLLRTDLFSYDFSYVSTIFANNFSVLELNTHKKKEFLAGIDEIKYGSLIQLFSSKYLIRYTLQPNKRMVIQISILNGKQNFSQFILTNLAFILQS